MHRHLARLAGLVVDLDVLVVRHEVISWSGASCSFTARSDLVEPSWSANVTHGLITSSTAVPRCANAALSSGRSCFGSPENERATKPQPSSIASAQQSIGMQLVDVAGLARAADVGGGGELALGEPVDAVVLDDVDDRHVAAHQVAELAEPDAGGVAVARDADAGSAAVREVHAGRDGGHAAVHGVEAVRAAEEVGGRLAGAADARELRDAVRLEAQLERGLDDAAGDGVVAAAGAQGRLRAVVVGAGSGRPGCVGRRAAAVGSRAWRSSGSRTSRRARGSGSPSITVLGVDRQPVVVEDERILRGQLRVLDAGAATPSGRRGSARPRRRARGARRSAHLVA